MGRTANIVGRIRRQLKAKDVPYNRILQDELYEEMQIAQNDIILKTSPEYKHEIAMLLDESIYPLVVSDLPVIKSIQSFEIPEDWDIDEIEIIDNQNWDEIVHATVSGSYPLYATIFANELRLLPAPGSEIAGDDLGVMTFLHSSPTEIGESVEPSVNPIWDLAIEYFVLDRVLPDSGYYQRYVEQIETKKHILHVKHHQSRHQEPAW